MTDKSRAAAAAIAGAAIGGVLGYILFTERGRQLRRRLEPALDDFAQELNGFRLTVEKAAGLAGQGWRLLNEAMEPGDRPRYPGSQSSPF